MNIENMVQITDQYFFGGLDIESEREIQVMKNVDKVSRMLEFGSSPAGCHKNDAHFDAIKM